MAELAKCIPGHPFLASLIRGVSCSTLRSKQGALAFPV